jgi:hypothetical protein
VCVCVCEKASFVINGYWPVWRTVQKKQVGLQTAGGDNLLCFTGVHFKAEPSTVLCAVQCCIAMGDITLSAATQFRECVAVLCRMHAVCKGYDTVCMGRHELGAEIWWRDLYGSDH